MAAMGYGSNVVPRSPVPVSDVLADLIARAEKAGHEAAMASVPAPMVVSQHADMLNDESPVEQSWLVPEGVCGFAWVIVKPGTSKLAKYLKATGAGRTDSYYGGVNVWVRGYGQSMMRKEAYAHAYAKVLTEAGYRATAMSRMD